MSGRSVGVMLVEWLLALALAGVVMALAAAALRSTNTWVGVLDARITRVQREVAVPVLVAELLAGAGRGLDGCALTLAAGGTLVRWQTQLRGQLQPHTLELFAARDGARRPALYQRQLPHARQPWLEDVVHLRVLEVLRSDGAWVAPSTSNGERIHALRLSLVWDDGSHASIISPLPHAPCLEASG